VSRDFVSGFHEGNFGLRLMTFLVDGMYIRILTWQVSIRLVGIIGVFLQRTLEGRPGGMCGENLDLH